ncbi:hypothetical protein [uncultured Eudoraea sp.]|uniref:hypothetical protein n=1 Tax=uncultured Eudoraea sp. TaxID=1035614 RepID=UPI00262C4BAF|nr:hypothetical protein [uncultured Eudoraea sp.]
MLLRSILIISFILLSSPMVSQTCCSGGVPLSNNLGLPIEQKGIWQFGLNYDHNNLNTLYAGNDKLNDDSRQRITNSLLLSLGYSITDRFALEALFSWVNQTRTITQFGNENFTETAGIGDALLLAKYAFPEVFGTKSVINLGLGIKAPLGKSDFTNEDGITLTADLQPGSGAWDGLGWFSASKAFDFRPSATFSGNFTYRFTGVNNSYLNNTSTYEFGNVVQANVGYTDQFLLFNTIFNPGLIFKYRNASNDKINDLNLPNTGGEWVFIRPELSVHIITSLLLTLRLELPIYSYVDGTQLTPTTRFTAGLYFKLNNKNTTINI